MNYSWDLIYIFLFSLFHFYSNIVVSFSFFTWLLLFFWVSQGCFSFSLDFHLQKKNNQISHGNTNTDQLLKPWWTYYRFFFFIRIEIRMFSNLMHTKIAASVQKFNFVLDCHLFYSACDTHTHTHTGTNRTITLKYRTHNCWR